MWSPFEHFYDERCETSVRNGHVSMGSNGELAVLTKCVLKQNLFLLNNGGAGCLLWESVPIGLCVTLWLIHRGGGSLQRPPQYSHTRSVELP